MSYLIAISGASGSIYGLRLIEELNKRAIEIGLIITDPALMVIKDELDFEISPGNILEDLKKSIQIENPELIRIYDYRDIAQEPASGSNVSQGMIVIPASMASVGAMAAGLGNNLLTRAADVHLKQQWPLIVVPRETPMNLIHLRNLVQLAETGATIIPAIPAFYHHPKTVDDLINFVVGKILENIGFEHDLYNEWKADNC